MTEILTIVYKKFEGPIEKLTGFMQGYGYEVLIAPAHQIMDNNLYGISFQGERKSTEDKFVFRDKLKKLNLGELDGFIGSDLNEMLK